MNEYNINDEYGYENYDYLDEVIQKTLETEQVEHALFSVVFVGNEEIQEINKLYRGLDKVTDVISFALEDNPDDFCMDTRVLGDIYVCIPRMKEQANTYGHSEKRELSFLVVHGLLHLLGYDHMVKEEEEVMFALQDKILEGVGIISQEGGNVKSGFVSIIGRPNVGKSTLLNAILDFKVAIISNKAGTTRNIIQGIYNDLDTQIVFMDTPGIHKPKNKLGKFLNKESYALTKDVDAILFVVDAKEGIGTGDRFILETLKKSESPVILVLNKIDCLNNEGIIGRIEEYKDIFPFAEIVPVSALKKDNVGRLIEVIKKYLTDNVRYFDDDMVTSNSMSFMASELVREKLLNVTIEEIPHSITCVTTKFESHSSIVNICVDIIVDRDSIKKIIIGKGGERLKLVGSEARKELEAMLGKKVYLELYVRTIKNWREKTSYLKELGFNELDLK